MAMMMVVSHRKYVYVGWIMRKGKLYQPVATHATLSISYDQIKLLFAMDTSSMYKYFSKLSWWISVIVTQSSRSLWL